MLSALYVYVNGWQKEKLKVDAPVRARQRESGKGPKAKTKATQSDLKEKIEKGDDQHFKDKECLSKFTSFKLQYKTHNYGTFKSYLKIPI